MTFDVGDYEGSGLEQLKQMEADYVKHFKDRHEAQEGDASNPVTS